MRLFTILCYLLYTSIASAQKNCDSLFSYLYSPYETTKYTAGPMVVAQKIKTPCTRAQGQISYLWTRKTGNRIFLYGELMHDSSLGMFDTIPLYHGKLVFTFVNGDTISAQSFPAMVDALYPSPENISFILLLNKTQKVRNPDMRRLFNLSKTKIPGELALATLLSSQLLKQVAYTQGRIMNNADGQAELQYTAPITFTIAPEQAEVLQQTVKCLLRSMVDTRFP